MQFKKWWRTNYSYTLAAILYLQFTISLYYTTLRCCWKLISRLLSCSLLSFSLPLSSLSCSVNIDDSRSVRGRNCTRCGAAAICPSSNCQRAMRCKMNIHLLKNNVLHTWSVSTKKKPQPLDHWILKQSFSISINVANIWKICNIKLFFSFLVWLFYWIENIIIGSLVCLAIRMIQRYIVEIGIYWSVSSASNSTNFIRDVCIHVWYLRSRYKLVCAYWVCAANDSKNI